ncbi:hypothetical protein ACFVUS_40755 [Nocardia sp. NPDC058058]|uniref:hypothetical protein n=1 Tax=Nocardia sp. NPDC058058 TaxID=3346317 RepID=UPI0036DE4ADB
MTEKQEVVSAFERDGVSAGIRWAYRSAIAETMEMYAARAGLDETWVGTTRYTLLRDRLDRVFSCERFGVGAGSAGVEETPDSAIRDLGDMPELGIDLVARDGLNGSPGWVHGKHRFLLASSKFGQINHIPWPQKSRTKQGVARQSDPDSGQQSLFDPFAPDEIDGLAAVSAALAERELDLPTFVVAHSLDRFTGDHELVIGRPQFNLGGGDAWVWQHNLLDPPDSAVAGPSGPPPIGPDPVPDAPVRLRGPVADQRTERGTAG